MAAARDHHDQQRAGTGDLGAGADAHEPGHDRSSTKDRLLAAAEKLFAESGFDGVSVRDLAAEADVNVAAVNYHFQGKENLYRAVLLRRLHHKRDASLAALETAPRGPDGRPDLEALIEGFVRQYLEETLASAHGANFMRLIAWELHDHRRGGTTFQRELVLPVHERFSRRLREAAPGLRETSASWAIMGLVGQIVHVIMRWYKCNEVLPGTPASELMAQTLPALQGPRDEYIRAAVAHLTRFTVGGIRALAAHDAAGAPAADGEHDHAPATGSTNRGESA